MIILTVNRINRKLESSMILSADELAEDADSGSDSELFTSPSVTNCASGVLESGLPVAVPKSGAAS